MKPHHPHSRMRSLWLVLAAVASLSVSAAPAAKTGEAPTQRPNVLFILIDDHAANMISVLNESPVRTPNMERLAARGSWFHKAYNPVPVCAASRAAFLTGMQASKSGMYYNSQAYRRSTAPISKAITMQRQFLDNGYIVAGYGKLNHTGYQDDNLSDFTPGYFKGHRNKKYVTNNDGDLRKHLIPETLRVPDPTYRASDFGALPDDWDRDDPTKWQQDTEQASRTIEFLKAQHDKPFFVSCGFWRPHSERFVPKRYYDMYPLELMKVPPSYRADDLDDVPAPGRWRATAKGTHARVINAGMWMEYLRSYYASTTYVDEQLGRVLDALDQSAYAKNTIIVFASDNGYNGGEKNMWAKFALWDQTCRVVFCISVPGLPQQYCPSPVSLLDIYPTLLDLCGLPAPSTHHLDGIDLTPILKGERIDRGQPVLSTYGLGNHSIRDWRFRYIRYLNGDEELYDHDNDRYEFTNLAKDPRFASIKAKLASQLPTENAPEIEQAIPWDGSELRADLFNQWEPGALNKVPETTKKAGGE